MEGTPSISAPRAPHTVGFVQITVKKPESAADAANARKYLIENGQGGPLSWPMKARIDLTYLTGDANDAPAIIVQNYRPVPHLVEVSTKP